MRDWWSDHWGTVVGIAIVVVIVPLAFAAAVQQDHERHALLDQARTLQDTIALKRVFAEEDLAQAAAVASGAYAAHSSFK